MTEAGKDDDVAGDLAGQVVRVAGTVKLDDVPQLLAEILAEISSSLNEA